MNVKYVGAFLDYSGYGEAVRHDIGALLTVGINVTTEYVKFAQGSANFGKLGGLAKKYQNKNLDYKIKILHLTPNIFPKYVEEGKYNIGRVFWETDKLPPDFAAGCQCLQEIWTGSPTNKQAIVKAIGNKIPIHIIPEAIETETKKPKPFDTDIDKDAFKFYSVFEWTTRKNPQALLRAYLTEFKKEDNVALMLKTYVDNFTMNKKNEIKSEIKGIKNELKLDYFPPVYLYTDLMDRHEVHRFHATGDCFVSTSRGEGWGIPQMEAMLFEKPVITSQCGGISDHLKNGIEAEILPTKAIPVKNPSRNAQWYREDQNWFDVKIEDVRAAMRKVYEDRQYRADIARTGHARVNQSFSLKALGAKMMKRLEMLETEVKNP